MSEDEAMRVSGSRGGPTEGVDGGERGGEGLCVARSGMSGALRQKTAAATHRI